MRKRFLSALLSLTLLASLLPAAVPRAAALTIDETYNTGAGKGGGGGELVSSIFKNAVVRNTPASGKPFGAARSLEVAVKTKAFGSKNSIFALVMRASDYKQGPQSSMGINETTYAELKVNAANYAIGRKNPESATDEEEITLPLVTASTENAGKLAADTSVTNKEMPLAQIPDASSYYDEYVLIVFAAEQAADDNFYVDRFYVDADGYVRTPSYLVRYNGKGAETNTVPAREIIRAKTYDELTDYSVKGETPNIAANPPAGTPKRVGYTFLGWDTNSTATTPTYTKGSTLTKPANSTGELYHIIDLYAVWKAIPVAFDADMASVDTKTLADPKVGKDYEQKGSLHVVDSGEPEVYRTDKRSGKTFTVTKAEWKTSAEADAAWTEIPADNGGLLDAKKMPNGLKLESDGNIGWKITGKPNTKYAYPIRLTVQVKDNGNASTDTLMIVFNKIEKGDIAPPARDVNTGLQTNVLANTGNGEAPTPTEGGGVTEAPLSDGVIFGFYSQGQDAENGYTNANGSGSLYDYYTSVTKGDWTEALIYEYIPYLQPDGTSYNIDEADNANWREVPMPESFYKDVAEADKALLGDSMKSAATEKAHSSYKASGMAVTKDTPAASPEGTAWAGWDATYGEIRFEKVDAFGALSPSEGNGFPVVHGLVEGATYKVRFKQNSDFGQSDPVELVIAAGGGGGGSSGGSGAADPSDCATIVFYDWDNTLLGSTVVVKNQSAKDQVDAFTNVRIAHEVELDPKYLWYSNDQIQEDISAGRVPKYLSNKKGYDFDTWLINDSNTFTAQNEALPTYADDADAAAMAGVADFSSVTGDMIVKASYKANQTLNCTSFDDGVWSGNDIRYSFGESKYLRYGAAASDSAGSYGITLSIKRENSYGFGVTRAREPALRSSLTTDTALTKSTVTIYSLSVLKGRDEETAEIVPAKTIGKVTCALIDNAAIASWPTGSIISVSKTENKNSGSIGSNGFIKYGTIAFINAQARLVASGQTNNWSWVNAQAFKDAGLSTTVAGNVNNAKNNITEYFKNHPDIADLSDIELQDVIDGVLK